MSFYNRNDLLSTWRFFLWEVAHGYGVVRVLCVSVVTSCLSNSKVGGRKCGLDRSCSRGVRICGKQADSNQREKVIITLCFYTVLFRHDFIIYQNILLGIGSKAFFSLQRHKLGHEKINWSLYCREGESGALGRNPEPVPPPGPGDRTEAHICKCPQGLCHSTASATLS